MIRTHGKKATLACPCGHRGDDAEPCRCTPREVQRYRGRISGPLWDRIDLRVEVPRPEMTDLLPALHGPDGAIAPTINAGEGGSMPTHVELKRQVVVARSHQQRRAGCLNARLPVQRLAVDCALDNAARKKLEDCQTLVKLTGRGLHRILRVARTIADLEACTTLREVHVAEAIQFHRPMV